MHYDTAGKTVLVVEDEVLVRMAVADYLQDCGLRVLEAGKAADAIAILRSTGFIDVVFTDVQMPGGFDGFQLCRWINVHRAEVRVILTSGGLNGGSVPADLYHAGPVMAKPYQLQDVLVRVRETLGDSV